MFDSCFFKGSKAALSSQEVYVSKKERKLPDEETFRQEMERMLACEEIQQMEAFHQHNGNNTLQHVRNVASRSFQLAQKFGWDIDVKSLVRGALLHDFYLYSVRDQEIGAYDHGIHHPVKALKNAKKKWDLSPKEENIIRSHMWPLTFLHPPMSREALLVSLADKDCAVQEMLLRRKNLEK